MLGPHSNPFKLTSVCITLQDKDHEVAFFFKRQKMEDSVEELKGLVRKANTLAGTVSALQKQVTHLAEETASLKSRVEENASRVADLDFWLMEVSTMPIFAFFKIIQIYLRALNAKAKALIKGNDLEKEFNHCSKEQKQKGEPCPHYAFLHGILVSNVAFENDDLKRIALEKLHSNVTGIETTSILGSLENYMACKDDRNGGGHPMLDDGDKKQKLLLKAEEMLKTNLLPHPFNGKVLRNLLVLAIKYQKLKKIVE